MSKPFNYARLYDRMAPFYAPAMRLLPVWRRYTESALPWLSEAGTVLEIGPGPGVLLRKLSERHPLAVGFDLSPGMLRQAQRHLRRAGLPVRLAQGDATHLPFAENSFDGVVMTFAFSAIPDGQAALDEVARVLRPGGLGALVDACRPDNGSRIACWLARQWERFGDFMRDESALMRAAGLVIVERREFGAFNSIRITVGRKPGGA
ncbi:MAG: class I SAM-dependent methyltransferase [Anaerolineae bacterium]|nr:class I SAM-dependent methyltransferase [Anaerolineae bacterium]